MASETAKLGRSGIRAFFEPQDYLTLLAAGLSFAGSVALWFSGDREAGQFVGLWVPSIIAFGIYVKLHTLQKGMDR